MNFLPKLLLDKQDLKRTINSLMLEEEALPKPVVIKAQPKKPEEEKKQKDENKPASDPS